MFEMGCFYVPHTDTFWQVSRNSDDGRFQYVQMSRDVPDIVFTDGPRLCMGQACYRGTTRLDVYPSGINDVSAEAVAPLLESSRDGAVVGLRMHAPDGVLALLNAGDEPRRAVLQIEVRGKPAMPFGAIEVKRPWLAQLFVYDGHLWVAHPDMPQALGWQL